MDAFFASVEILDQPELKGKPIAVGGKSTNRGVLSTCNYEARKFGIHSAMPTAQAIKKCPYLILLPSRMQRYKEISQKINKIFKRFTNKIEPLSLDEAYLDVSECKRFNGSSTLIAEEIRKNIREELNLTASAGISNCKMLAKIASDWNKPDGQFTIKPNKISEFMISLDLKKIPGVGKVSYQKFKNNGYTTCGQLQQASMDQLILSHGKQGERLYYLCRGIDNSPVISHRQRKSLSVEFTYPKDLENLNECLEKLPSLYQEFLKRYKKIEENNKLPRFDTPFPLFVKIKYSNFQQTTIERHFNNLSRNNFKTLLIERYNQKPQNVRLLGIGIRFSEKKTEIKSNPTQLEFDI